MTHPSGQPPVFLSLGFRPFFLIAGVYACVAMAAWLAALGYFGDTIPMTAEMPANRWHAHEMLFGYTAAVIAGFLLTAVPNWTKSPPVQGPALAMLVFLWAAGRAAIWFSAFLPAALVAAMDLAFLPALLWFIARPIIVSRSRRNYIIPVILMALFAANLLVHLENLAMTEDTMGVGHRLALNAIVVLIALIGGRVVPNFTANALRRQDITDLPVSWKPVEIASLAVVAVLALADLIAPGGMATGLIAALAALVHAVRLAGWRGWRTLNQPIVWILHLAYSWLVVGLACKAMALLGGSLDESTAIHALTAGAVGSMTLALMTRASLGHTGRDFQVVPAITAAFGLLSAVAVVRVAVPPWFPEIYDSAMLAAGLGWIAAFAVYSALYWPILTRPRIDASGP